MKKWLNFNISYPKSVLFTLILITIIGSYGIYFLEFDSTLDSLMPQNDPTFHLGETAKKYFGDNKTFMVTSIEPSPPFILFSPQVFGHIYEMVKELKEYREFNQELEDNRLKTILNISKVEIEKETEIKDDEKKPQKEIISDKIDDIEADLDAEILGDSSGKIEKKQIPPKKISTPIDTTAQNEIKEQKETIEEKNTLKLPAAHKVAALDYEKPHRKRYKFNYDKYKPVSIEQIREKLDSGGRKQLDTILKTKVGWFELKDILVHEPLSEWDFKIILEAWEDLYLFKSLEIIDTLMDPITVEDMLGTKNELKTIHLLDKQENGEHILPETDLDFKIYKKKILKHPLYRSVLYALNEKKEISALGMTVKLTSQEKYDKFMHYFWPMVKKYDTSPVNLDTMGGLVFTKFMTDYEKRDLKVFLPITIAVIIITFFLNFRSFRGVLLPTIAVMMGGLWTLGLMGYLGYKLTVIANVLPPLLIAIGSSYSIHIFNQYMYDLRAFTDENKPRQLLSTMNHISTTVFLAGFTTFVSFMILLVNQVTGLSEFGLFAALGVAFAVVISVMLIPSVLVMLPILNVKKYQPEKIREKTNKQNQEKNNSFLKKHLVSVYANCGIYYDNLLKNFIKFLSRMSVKYPKVILIIFIPILIISINGVTKVKTETAPGKFFKSDSEISISTKHIGKIFDGHLVLNLILDSGEKNGVKRSEFLTFAEKIRRWLEKTEQRDNYNILHNTAFSDFIKRMHMAMNSDNPDYFEIPKDSVLIQDYIEIFSGEDDNSDGRPDAFESTVDKDYRMTNILVRLGQWKGQSITTEVARKASNHILDYLGGVKNPKNYRYAVVGEPVNFVLLGKYIVNGQILGIILSIIIVGLAVFLLFKNPFAGLVALIPISLTITIVFGYMGYQDIPLDVAKAILSSIAIGIGIDDTIHFLNTLRKNRKEGKSLAQSIQITHKMAGTAIVYTSVALIFGFSVLMLSNFYPVFHFGFLISSVMAVTTISALLVLPSIIYLLNIKVEEEKSWKFLQKINLGRFLD
jgi:predicted RND superfamily exporter protein